MPETRILNIKVETGMRGVFEAIGIGEITLGPDAQSLRPETVDAEWTNFKREHNLTQVTIFINVRDDISGVMNKIPLCVI